MTDNNFSDTLIHFLAEGIFEDLALPPSFKKARLSRQWNAKNHPPKHKALITTQYPTYSPSADLFTYRQ